MDRRPPTLLSEYTDKEIADEHARRLARARAKECRVGDYVADYTPLTHEEMATTDPHTEELFRNSKPTNRRD